MASSGMNGNGAGNGNGSSQVLVTSTTSGVTVIDPTTPLKRLNYFDGKFLRADDFDVEQRYLRRLVAASNQGLGPGVVYGYDTTLASGDAVQIGPGLAMDPSGNVLLLQSTVTQNIQDLIDASKASATATPDASGKSGSGKFSDCITVVAPPPTVILPVSDIYVIAICAAEALCGQADVYGKLCEEACVTSSERPYRLDGVVLRAIPLQLTTPFPTSKAVDISANAYLRSKVAHSWYADEVLKHPGSISRAGLLSSVWCLGAGYTSGCCEVPLAVVARAGSSTVFLDAWIVRRERMDTPPKRYWQWKMRMRPWDVFIAEILQFQCQLSSVLANAATPGSRTGDPCAPHYTVLQDAMTMFTRVQEDVTRMRKRAPAAGDAPLAGISATELATLSKNIHIVLNTQKTPAQASDRVLIRGGIIELPPAGYLPVLTGTSVTVNDQVRALLGDGLDLRFCITTADYVAGAVEERQHMDRISLLQGLDDPASKPHVDILVPDGTATQTIAPTEDLYDASLGFSLKETGGFTYEGAARETSLAGGGSALYIGAAGLSQDIVGKFTTMAKAFQSPKARSVTYNADLDSNPFVIKPKATPARFDVLLNDTAENARNYAASAGQAAEGTPSRIISQKVPTAYGSVDGLWLTARTEKEIESLGIDDQTALSLRAVVGMHPAKPEAVELTFNGELTVTRTASTAHGPVLHGMLTGIYAVGMLKENQQLQKTTEFLITERGRWPVAVAYTSESAGSAIAMTLEMPGGTFGIRLTRTAFTGGARIAYTLALVPIVNGRAGTAIPAGRIRLLADSDIVNATNSFHRYADAGLDIVQAALIVSEPQIKKKADAVLFPPATNAATELAIQAVRDWVAFVKRREKQCALDVAPAPALPPRRYRVLNINAENMDEAKSVMSELENVLANQTKLASWLGMMIKEHTDETPLIVTFDGGAATVETSAAAIESDWRTFHPGSTIFFAAAGAVGETDTSLQLQRVKTVESAISVDSQESATAKEVAIVPYPTAAVPSDADGIMLFVTITDSEPQHVWALNGDQFNGLYKLAQETQPPPLNQELARSQAVDLGVATFTVGAGSAVAVDDATVVANFKTKLSGMSARAGFLIFAPGTTSSDNAKRLKAGSTVGHDVTPAASVTKSVTWAGAWPSGFPSSVLILEAENT